MRIRPVWSTAELRCVHRSAHAQAADAGPGAEAECSIYIDQQILVSHRIYVATEEFVRTASLGEQAIAGFMRPVTVYAVQGARGAGVSGSAMSPPPVADAGPLSDREREVVNLIVRGCTNREIAEALVIAEGTAVRHVANILNKLNLHSRAQVAVWAVQRTQPSTHHI